MTDTAPSTDPAVTPASTTAPDTTRVVDRRLATLVLLIPAITIAIGGWIHRWTDEDAFINFRIVDQIFNGHGPVFNAGERIETYTSTAWLGVLVVGRAALSWAMGMEWISVLLGLGAAVAAFAIGAIACRRLHAPGALVVPIGLIAVAAVPVVWDFATSGLEMGLVWLWIATAFLVLVHAARVDDGTAGTATAMTNRVRRWSLIVIGLGPLVRPDIGVMTLTALVAWFLLVRPRRVVHDLAIALAVPVAYEVFRMGYFANLVPNTALAKDSSGFYLQQGWHYLTDLTNTYALWIPLAVIAAVLIGEAVESRDRRRTVACGAIVLGGILHGAYIVVSGGDYMHGRLLLPSLFAVALPAAVALPLRRSRVVGLLATGAVAAVVIWSAVVIAAVRYPATPPAYFGVADISDWRNLLHGQMFHHATMPKGVKNLGISAAQVHALYEAGARGFLHVFDTKPRPGRDPHKLVVTMGSIGVPGWAVGPDVFVVDIGGLAEPLAARSSPVPNQAAGHRKRVSATWYEARFGVQRGDPRVDAARRALQCQPLAGLIRAIDAPLTPGRFLSNLWHAPSYTFLHIARDPRVAERELCPHPGTR